MMIALETVPRMELKNRSERLTEQRPVFYGAKMAINDNQERIIKSQHLDIFPNSTHFCKCFIKPHPKHERQVCLETTLMRGGQTDSCHIIGHVLHENLAWHRNGSTICVFCEKTQQKHGTAARIIRCKPILDKLSQKSTKTDMVKIHQT